MPRYHFHVHDGRSTPDTDGTELPDARAARRAAIELAGAVLRDDAGRIAERGGGEGWRLEVTDAAGLTLFRMDFVITDGPAATA